MALVEVDLRPLQPEHIVLPQPGCQGKQDDFALMLGQLLNQALGLIRGERPFAVDRFLKPKFPRRTGALSA